jgi:hypothetical protein
MQLHHAVNKLPVHQFPLDLPQIPRNGIYILCEKGEYAHGANRIVRVGTHTGANQLRSPVIKTRGRHYECKIIYKSAMDPAHLEKDYDSSLYPKKDYHTLYFGEIQACYETD